jgi:hypothetical protein
MLYLRESTADPFSDISSTTSGSEHPRSMLSSDKISDDFLRKMYFMPLFPGFFTGGLIFSGGSMSTTMQVVSSLNPFTLTASCGFKKHKSTQLPNT